MARTSGDGRRTRKSGAHSSEHKILLDLDDPFPALEALEGPEFTNRGGIRLTLTVDSAELHDVICQEVPDIKSLLDYCQPDVIMGPVTTLTWLTECLSNLVETDRLADQLNPSQVVKLIDTIRRCDGAVKSLRRLDPDAVADDNGSWLKLLPPDSQHDRQSGSDR